LEPFTPLGEGARSKRRVTLRGELIFKKRGSGCAGKDAVHEDSRNIGGCTPKRFLGQRASIKRPERQRSVECVERRIV